MRINLETLTEQIELEDEKELSVFSTQLNESLKLIEDALGVLISVRGNKVIMQGDSASVGKAKDLINELRSVNKSGFILRPDDVRLAVRNISAGQQVSLSDMASGNVVVAPRKRLVIPKTENQRKYIDAVKDHDMVIGIGPAGTGKTYLAMAMAVSALLSKRVSRVVLARPAVEAGEKLGFLPGDIYEKVNPYLRPLYDALYDMMEVEKANRLMERGTIEIAPLAFMRGRTLNDSFIILDEAQNTTSEQMKMYLTRLGFNSKTVITGDITQIDLPAGKTSGLVEAEKIVGGIEGVKIVYFSEKDVVRHRLVQDIIRAYEAYERRPKG